MGTYYLEFFDVSKHPKSKRYSLRTKHRRAALIKQQQFETLHAVGDFDPWLQSILEYEKRSVPQFTDLSFRNAVKRFLKSRKELNRSEETIRTYQEVLKGLSRVVQEDGLVAKIDSTDVRYYVYDSRISTATSLKRYGHLRTFFRWLELDLDLKVDWDRLVPKPRKQATLPKSVSWGQLETICEVMQNDYCAKLINRQVSEGEIIWRIPLFKIGILTGMRISELARLVWSDVDMLNGRVQILKQKNGHQQEIPLCQLAVDILKNIGPESSSEFVFSSPRGKCAPRSNKRFSENSGAAFRKYRRQAQLPEGLSLHGLRHGFCTALAKAGETSVCDHETG